MASHREERMQVLKMVEAGTISADEGAKLLAALGHDASEQEPIQPPDMARWMRIRVTDLKIRRSKVNVSLPMGLVSVGVKMGAQFVPGTQGVMLDEVVRTVNEGAQGKIAEVEDVENNERVEIYVE